MTGTWGLKNACALLGVSLATLGCIPPGATTASSTSTAGRTSGTALTYPDGARAAKFIFKNTTSGSFSTPAAGGGSLDAVRVFNADNSLLASGTTSSSWPKWISGVTIGISGASNSAALHANCARFASGESAAQCDFDGDGTYDDDCGAQDNLYRVSEYDCASGSITDGVGNASDGVFIRATFNRSSSAMASHENVMVVLEYVASSFQKPAADASKCFTGSVFDPTHTDCAAHSWQLFLIPNTTSTYAPFVTLVPPFGGYVDATADRGGGTPMTRQFILPLAGSTATTVLQISRMKGLATGATAYSRCKDSGQPTANSPLCNGMIFHSMTLFRL